MKNVIGHQLRSCYILLSLLFVLFPFPSSADYAENNAADWDAAAPVDNASVSIANDTTRVKAGAASIRFDTASSYDTYVVYPKARNAAWDLSTSDGLEFWLYAANSNGGGFRGSGPNVYLKDRNGNGYQYRLNTNLINYAIGRWERFRIPLAGDAVWQRTVLQPPVGTGNPPPLSSIDYLEIHGETCGATCAKDVLGFGFTLWIDNVGFYTIPVSKPPIPSPPFGVRPEAVQARVLAVIYDPTLSDGRKHHDAYGWGDPEAFINQLLIDYNAAGHGAMTYTLVDKIIVNGFPCYTDGFCYTNDTFYNDLATGTVRSGAFDYVKMVRDYGIASRVVSGDIDEVWVYSDPSGGLWEAAMAGDGAYWINGIANGDVGSTRAFVIMGWNYERGLAEAMESHAHRTDWTLGDHIFGDWRDLTLRPLTTPWNRFLATDCQYPDNGGLGDPHRAVNASPCNPSDLGYDSYDRDDTRFVSSSADDWYNYPNMTGARQSINCVAWGCDAYGYLKWWNDRLPHVNGATDGRVNNFWRYIVDVDQFKYSNGYLSADWTAPTVTITNPAPGQNLPAKPFTVTAQAADDNAVGRVDFYVDGTYVATDSIPPFTFNWNPAPTPGTRTLTAKAYDLPNGYEGVSQTVTVSVNTDTTAPGAVTGFTAVAGDHEACLSWGNPADADLAGVRIVRKTGGFPTLPNDGTIIYDQGGTSFVDSGLANGTAYYYAAYAHDYVPNYAAAKLAAAIPFLPAPPTAQDGTENNVISWTCGSAYAVCSVANDTTVVKVGTSSIRFNTKGGFDTWVRYPVNKDANWNLTNTVTLDFWVYTVNSNPFQGNQPIVYLYDSLGNYFRYEPTQNWFDMAKGVWTHLSIPLAGDATWIRTSHGTPSFDNIDYLEIHGDTWDFGYTAYFDGLAFSTAGYASAETTVSGTKTNSYTSTFASDNVYEQLAEVVKGSTSVLEHRWTFNVVAGKTVTFRVEAYRPSNPDGDNFRFDYSKDAKKWTQMVTVTQSTDENLEYLMPTGTQGTIYVRVVDTNRATNKKSLDSVYVDRLYFFAQP